MQSFADILLTPDVQAEQERFGVREKFQKVYQNRFKGDLDERTCTFIETRTSFYMATISQSNWPYIQHRGGPVGFLKVLDGKTLGFADYHGNQQFISMGNLKSNNRVSMILMDYPTQSRLKLVGHMIMVDAVDDPKLVERVKVDGEGPVERVAKIDISAMDWNCPKYIEQRYTQDEVLALVGPQLAKRDQTIAQLKHKLLELGVDADEYLAAQLENDK